MDIKFLSRKFILSAILTIMSTIFLLHGLISDTNWHVIISATVISYIISKTIDKKTTKNNNITIIDRIKSLFSREFMLSLIVIIGSGILCWYKMINGNIWYQIVVSIGGVYNIFNSISKNR